MNKDDVLYERELLFATDNELEIGVVYVKLVSSRQNNKIVTIIHPKSGNDIIQYAESILKSLDAEMFSRIKVNILKNVDIVFNENQKPKRVVFETSDSILPFHFEDLEQSEIDMIK